MTKFYVYKITNLLTSKIYIGYHKSSDIENDNYMGSSRKLSNDIKLFGPREFKREILFEYDIIEDALIKEKELVNKTFIKRSDTYNLAIGGAKGWVIDEPHNKGKICIYSPLKNKNYYIDEKDLQVYLDAGDYIRCSVTSYRGKNCIERNEKIIYSSDKDLQKYLDDGWVKSNTTKNRICMSHNTTNLLKYVHKDEIEKHEKLGYKIGNKKAGVNKGRISISKNKKNLRIFEADLQKYLDDGWIRKRYDAPARVKRIHNLNTKKIKNINIDKEDINSYLDNGWAMGTGRPVEIGKIFINKDNKNKKIFPNELEIYVKNKWQKGLAKIKSPEQSPRFIGYYITPMGKFNILCDAARIHNISIDTVRLRCKTHTIITNRQILRNHDLAPELKGLSYKSLGWDFISRSDIIFPDESVLIST